MTTLNIRHRKGQPFAEQPVEIVERKGLGHPDTICDALAEEYSHALCKYYLKHHGTVLHHNVDKVLLRAGASTPRFGGGIMLQPIEIFLAGRATEKFGDTLVPLQDIANECVCTWLQKNFHCLDPEQHIRLQCLTRPGSQELTELFLRQQKQGIWLANDTSCGVGYAPLSRLEHTILKLENTLNATDYQASHPEIGEDIKLMGVRSGRNIKITMACAFIDRFIKDIHDYAEKKSRLAQDAMNIISTVIGDAVEIDINTGDDLDQESIFMTVTGTSAEAGDDGQAGRGNRINGLITPYRPMTIESVAGKNPITHVGKLYNFACGLIAEDLVDQIPALTNACCYLVSQIGKPISEPQTVDVHIWSDESGADGKFRKQINEIARQHLQDLNVLYQDIITGKLAMNRWPLRKR